MADGVSLIRPDGGRTWLKWHRGRREIGDVAFTAARLIEALRLGASAEIDLLCHADGGFAVLHDVDLDRATTGKGLVAETSALRLRHLFLRDDAGVATNHPVLLLDDLARLVQATDCAEGAVLQLDLKEGAEALGTRQIEAFVEAIAPICRHVILSAGDAEAVASLSEVLPDLPVGYDPCHFGTAGRVMGSGDYAGFVAEAIEASPKARMIYLEYPLVLAAHRAGYGLIDAFHRHGRAVDAYTIRRAEPSIVADVRTLLALGVDQITTDDPVGLERLLTTT